MRKTKRRLSLATPGGENSSLHPSSTPNILTGQERDDRKKPNPSAKEGRRGVSRRVMSTKFWKMESRQMRYNFSPSAECPGRGRSKLGRALDNLSKWSHQAPPRQE